MKEAITEKFVAHIWQHQLVTSPITDAGDEVDVVFPGRPCTSGGGDFCDAVLTIGNKLLRGDIEVHVRSSQWYSHGHHRDSRYNNITLHVVMWRDYPTATVLQSGKVIPCVSLGHFLNLPSNGGMINLWYRCPSSCQRTRKYFKGESLAEVLITAGKERFASKVTHFRRSLLTEDAGQVLFRNIAKALGYEKNSRQCEELAELLPLRLLEGNKHNEESLAQQTLILGTAGLLPSQRFLGKHEIAAEPEIAELEMMWQSNKTVSFMHQSDWRFFRLRPHNSPTRRLASLGYLIARYNHSGLLLGILNLVRQSPNNKGYCWIEDGLIIPSQGYWSNHSDFGVITTRNAALLGRGRAREIVVNIILPFVCAWGVLYAEPELEEKTIQIYLDYPMQEDNQLLRFMRQQLCLRSDFRLSALQQQGLLHIFKNYCRNKNCDQCPITISQN